MGVGTLRGVEGDTVTVARARLDAAVDAVVAVGVDALSEDRIVGELEVIERLSRRVDARRCELADALARRRTRRAREADPGDDRSVLRARRDTERELAGRLGVRQGQVKKAVDTGRSLRTEPATQAAFARGDISREHVEVLDSVLRYLLGEVRRQAEAQLVEAAKVHDPRELGTIARDLLAQLDPAAAVADEDRRHGNRRATVSQAPDGSTQLFGRWATVDGAIIARAVDAFRRPDRPGGPCRTPEQATADAIVEVCRAALDGTGAPTDHGVRPHVVATVPLDVLTSGEPTATVDLDGHPIAWEQVRHLLDDAGWSFVLTDHRGLPVAVTDEVRTVPAGPWRALTLRDGGCIADGCDREPQWCDVMHLDVPFAAGGRLTPATAALGCRTHHRAYDSHRLELRWTHGRPLLRPPPTTRDGPSP